MFNNQNSSICEGGWLGPRAASQSAAQARTDRVSGIERSSLEPVPREGGGIKLSKLFSEQVKPKNKIGKLYRSASLSDVPKLQSKAA